uniref:glycosyltransferase 61 family protein n=1 Tax=Phenylobacterium sp. TaxID=1871053 RepID=UPI003983C822
NPTAAFVLGASNRNLGRHAEAARALLSAYELLPDRADIAVLLLEETVTAQGLEPARPLFQRISARVADRRIAASWARLLFRAGAEAELPPGFVTAPLMSVPDWAAMAGVTMDWVGEPEVIAWVNPVIAGEPDAPRNRSTYLGYRPYVCTIRDATIFSRSSLVLTPDGAALHDSMADKDYGDALGDFMSELGIAERIGDRLLLDVGRYQAGDEIDAAMLLSGSVSEHFGHWISEYLPRLNLLRHHPRFETLPIIVDSVMPPQHFEFLRLLASNPIIQLPPGGALRCRELVVAAPTYFFPVHMNQGHTVPPERQGPVSVEAFHFMSRRVQARLPPPDRTDRKIYLSRRKRGGRRPRNEDEICAYLAARGFEILDPEDHTFADQVRIFQEAQVVVASNGSSLMNAIFSAPGTEFFVLSQRGIFNWGLFCGWMDALGYRVTFICCGDETPRKHAMYTVSIPELEAGLGASARTPLQPT